MTMFEVVCTQGCHGCDESVRGLLTRYLDWAWFGSFCDNEAVGGLLFGISKITIGKVGEAITFVEVFGGRRARLSIGMGEEALHIFNIHIEDSPKIDVMLFRKIMETLRKIILELGGGETRS